MSASDIGTNRTRVVSTAVMIWRFADQGDAGHDLVRPARESRQHRTGLTSVGRLAEHQTVDDDGRVRSEDLQGEDCVRIAACAFSRARRST